MNSPAWKFLLTGSNGKSASQPDKEWLYSRMTVRIMTTLKCLYFFLCWMNFELNLLSFKTLEFLLPHLTHSFIFQIILHCFKLVTELNICMLFLCSNFFRWQYFLTECYDLLSSFKFKVFFFYIKQIY